MEQKRKSCGGLAGCVKCVTDLFCLARPLGPAVGVRSRALHTDRLPPEHAAALALLATALLAGALLARPSPTLAAAALALAAAAAATLAIASRLAHLYFSVRKKNGSFGGIAELKHRVGILF